MTRDIFLIKAIFQIWPLWIICGYFLYKAVKILFTITKK